MTAIYLLRHGEASYDPVRDRKWPGSMADLAPLSAAGVGEAIAAAERLAEVRAQFADFESCGGEWPPGQRRPWEPLSVVRRRTTAALRLALAGMTTRGDLIAVCHEMVIRSLTGEPATGTGQFRHFWPSDLD